MKIKKIGILVIAVLLLMGCANKVQIDKDNKDKQNQTKSTTEKRDLQKQFALPEKGEVIAVMHVKDYGDIHIKFFPKVAPKAVENFITHSKQKYYDGLTFHRVIKDFVIQGGDPKGNGTGGESIWKKYFEDEFPPIENPMPLAYNGALAMANAGPNTNGSQFFIVNAPFDERVLANMRGFDQEIIELYKLHGGTPHLFYKHTVFGQVYKGMDIVRKIMDDKASNDKIGNIIIEKIDIQEYTGE